MSAHASEEEVRECLRLGAMDYLAKPFTLERLDLVLQGLELALFPERPLRARGPAPYASA